MIIIVSHDAGGAEILSSWVRRNGHSTEIFYLLEGPAQRVFEKKLKLSSNITRDEFLKISTSAEFILTGTSWQSDLEKFAIAYSLNNKIKVISFLDHWSNYLERFTYENNLILPNELWVGDEYAYRIASQLFSNIKILLLSNPYFLDIKDELENQNILYINSNSILYCSEPIAEHCLKSFGDAKYFGYDEYDALTLFLNWVLEDKFNLKNKQIIIRLHPADNLSKYDKIISNLPELNIKYSSNTSLIKDICSSSFIVGCESMALVIGLIAGKEVYTCIPPTGKKCVLPFEAIKSCYESI